MKHIIPLLSMTALIAVANSAAYAGEHKIYAGGGLGYSAIDTPSDSVFTIGSSSGSTTITQTESTAETGGLGGTFFAGVMLNKNFAIEADYVKYADSNYKSTQSQYTGSTLDGTNTATVDYKTQSFGLFLKGILPLSKRLDFSAKLGMDYVDQEVDYRNPDATPAIAINGNQLAEPKSGNNSYSEFRPAGGLGLAYHFNDKVAASVFFEGFLGSGDLDTDQDAIADAYITGLTISYTFG